MKRSITDADCRRTITNMVECNTPWVEAYATKQGWLRLTFGLTPGDLIETIVKELTTHDYGRTGFVRFKRLKNAYAKQRSRTITITADEVGETNAGYYKNHGAEARWNKAVKHHRAMCRELGVDPAHSLEMMVGHVNSTKIMQDYLQGRYGIKAYDRADNEIGTTLEERQAANIKPPGIDPRATAHTDD